MNMKTHTGPCPGTGKKSDRLPRRRLAIVALPLAALIIASLSYIASPPKSQALSTGIVISQVYPNGGTSGAAYQNDFIELFNQSNSPIDVAGWSVQYAVGNGAQSSNWSVTNLCGGASCLIQPHSYYLVKEGSSGASGAALPAPDATGAIDISPNNAKVALVNNTTALTGTCPLASVIDFVGFGNSANCSEGNSNAANPGNNDQSVCRLRTGNGYVETDNNGNDFSLCAPVPHNSGSGPALARMNLFKATGYANGKVLLEWETNYETANLGFNIYRESGGKRSRLNSRMIAGSALMVGTAALTAGRSYRYWDDAPTGEVVYWIEDVELSGRSTWHEPISIDRRSTLPSPDQRRPVFLDSLGRKQDATLPVQAKADLPTGTSELFGLQSRIASGTALKLSVRDEGWYRVTQPELIAAGMDPNIDPAYIQMFVDGREQPIAVTTESDGRFGASSTVEFYAIGISAATTDKRVYWLVPGSEPGARIQRAKSKGAQPANISFPYAVERADRSIYFSGLRNGDKENFFGGVVASSPVDQLLSIRHVDNTSTEEAVLDVALQGVTSVDHRVKVTLNDQELGEIRFSDQEWGVARLTAAQSLLREGQNQVRLIALAGEQDVSLVDRIKLTYRHTYTADDNSLKFTAQGRQRVTIGGFSTSRVRVIDITDPDSVQEVNAEVSGDGSYSATITVPGKKQRKLFAFADDHIGKPDELRADIPSRLRESREGGDLVIITRRELSAPLEPLKKLRESQGMRVAIIDVEDIYDEFSFGQKTPQAIKSFLSLAREQWQITPRYLVLAGDASFDPKNYLDQGDFDLVPTKLIDTAFMETASDDWFTDFDEDGIADLPVGRLPYRTTEEGSVMIDKIVGYENMASPEGVLLVSDSDQAFDFPAVNGFLRTLIPSEVKVDEIDRGVGDALTKATLLDALNRGPRIVNYLGHGSIDLWRGNILTGSDIGNLTNNRSLSLFISMTCLNGYFDDPSMESLSEVLLKSPHGGAVAVWASSGMTISSRQAEMDQEMFRLLFTARTMPTLGDVTTRAKAATTDDDVRRTWILFGDPSMRLK